MVELTEQQWEIVKPYLPQHDVIQQGKGRPRVDPRQILEGILWVLRTGAPWKDMPGRYPPYQTCHRRYQEWVENGILENILRGLLEDLESRGKIDSLANHFDGQ
jgi:transposase